MERINEAINHRTWVILLAFLPGVNVVYALFHFFFAHYEKKFYEWVIPVALLPTVILFIAVPEVYRLIAGYLFFYGTVPFTLLDAGRLCFCER